ncbi:MAG: myristoyl transferase [Rhodobacteraceae bacterium PARR1]|nr:MAG: myristoyl transferase [Rhodobacteraceae bacterium PARR1]
MKTAASTAVLCLVALSSPALAADELRILAPTWLGFAPVFVAEDTGCFAEKDLAVDMRFEDDLTNVMAAMERGDIDIQMRSVGEYQGRPRSAETPGIIIGTIDESVGGDGVITDGAIKTAADLKGKVVASEPNIPARLLLQLELKKAGLTLNDLEIRDIATADTGAVFTDDSISAIASYEPFMSQAIKASTRPDARVLVSSKDYPGIIVDAIIARNDDLAARPQVYGRFLSCIYKAVDFIQAEPQKFAELTAPHFGLTPEEVTEVVTGTLVYTTLDQSRTYIGTPDAPGTLYGLFDTVMQLNVENGAADAPLVAAQQIDSSIINLPEVAQ